MQTPARHRIGDLGVDAVTLDGAVTRIVALARGAGGTVLTPNVDHVVKAARHPDFRAAYGRAALAVCDGMPVLWAARLLGTPLPEKVSGSRLLGPLLAAAAAARLRVFVVGGRPGAARAARQRLAARQPAPLWVGHSLPSRQLEADGGRQLGAVEQQLAAAGAELVLVSLSAPRQEVWADACYRSLGRGAFVCTGSAIDIVAGLAPMAPDRVSQVGLEWAWRLAREPRRLARRYLWEDRAFVGIVARQWRELGPGRAGRWPAVARSPRRRRHRAGP